MEAKLKTPKLEGDSERPTTSALSGCLYATFVIVLSGGMLFVNAFLCLTIYAALPRVQSEDLAARIGQMFFFVAPVALMVVEWNLLDRVQRLFRQQAA
jgi:hypothetical protein